MHGAFFLASANRSLTLEAPTPTNISMNSVPAHEKNGTPASPATHRASNVFPVPGGPHSSTPAGIRAPIELYFSKSFKYEMSSSISSLTVSMPLMSARLMP